MNNDYYESIKEETLSKIKSMRFKRAPRPEVVSYDLNTAKRLFVYEDEGYSSYKFLIEQVNEESVAVVRRVIRDNLKERDIEVELVQISTQVIQHNGKDMIIPAPFLSFIKSDNTGRILYIFKEFGMQNTLPTSYLNAATKGCKADNYKIVSLVEGRASMENIGYQNLSEDEASEKTHLYSIRQFFEEVFDSEEYKKFIEVIHEITAKAKEVLGYRVVKTLTPSTLFSYKKAVEYKIKHFDYKDAVSAGISDEQMKEMEKQFFDKDFYKVMLGNKKFAVSFLTAEWLYDSLVKSGKIDFTAVAMGYLKSMEQFLYDFASLSTNEKDGRNRRIFAGRNGLIDLTDNNIANKKEDITLGCLTQFFQFPGNKDLLRIEIDDNTYEYIKNKLYDIKELRNGYFHKDNMEEWDIVEKARDNAYVLFYLFLGAYDVHDKDAIIGIPDTNNRNDYYKLCEYANYHETVIYYLDYGKTDERTGAYFSGIDKDISFNEFGDAEYSGVYFRRMPGIDMEKCEVTIGDVIDGRMRPKEAEKYTEEDLPKTIKIGTMNLTRKGMEISGPGRALYVEGKFIEQEEIAKPDF